MKKILFFAVAALFVSISVFAQEQDQERQQVDIQQAQPAPAQTQTQKDEKPIEFHMNFTNFGAGIFMTPFSIYGSIELLSFGVEHKKTGLGASFSPFNLFGYIGFNADAIDNNDSKNDDYDGLGYDDPSKKLGEVIPADGGISIINLTVYWNLISLISENEKFFMAPFIGFNYLFMGQTMDPSKYFFTAGFQGGIRGGSEKVKYNIFSVETGFRAINGDPKFFATIKFDFIMSLLNL